MTRLASFKTGLLSLFRKRRVERELDEELDSYLEASVRHKQQAGLSEAEALRRAKVEMGSRNSVKHQIWSSRWESTLDGIWQDVRLSLRSFLKTPGFTIVALVSLALGIGANTAIFTLINQVMLRALPVQNPEQLVSFGRALGGGINGGIDLGANDLVPYAFAHPMESDPGRFESVASYGSFAPKVTVRLPQSAGDQNSTSEQRRPMLVSGNFFTTLGSSAMLGRTILPSDTSGENAAFGHNAVVVLSYHFWQQQLSADPNVLGKTLSLNNAPYRVLGVMPKEFHGLTQELEPPDLYVPLTMQQQIMVMPDILTDRGMFYLHMVARRKALEMTPAGLKQDQLWLDQQVRTFIRAGEGSAPTPDRQKEIERATIPLVGAAHGVSQLGNQFGSSLMVLMIVVAVVLLMACANLANFLLARAATRQREIATRLALGSSRGRIIRQSLIETLLLSLLGGALGLGVAFAATRTLIAFVSQRATYTDLSPMPDVSILLFTLGVSLITGLLFGLGPALTAARTGATESLSSNARTTTAGRAGRLFPKFLVTAQVMLSLMLLIGAGLFLRTLRNLQAQDFGFERTHLLLAEFAPKLAGYRASQLPGLHQTIVERIEAIPGVRSASLSVTPPVGFANWVTSVHPSGYVPQPKEDLYSILNRVSGHYFATTGIAIVEGRGINDQDLATGPKVVVVNEAFAHHFFPKGNAIGQTMKIDLGGEEGPWQIVGIARDSRSGNPREPQISRMTYLPLAQMAKAPAADAGTSAKAAASADDNEDAFAGMIEVRTTGDPAQVIADLRHTIAQINPNMPLLGVHTIQEQVDSMMTREQLISSLTTIFSLLALLLAAIGLYGVMNYSVVRRTSELGIRLALGAQTGAVLWMVLRESLFLLGIGLALGLPLTLALTRVAADFLKAQLYGLKAIDPPTFAMAVMVVAGMTILAAWLPARRAAKVDPMVALRCD